MSDTIERLHSYPKVYNLGHPAIRDLFDGTVVVQEKVDGSQFTFGVIDGGLYCRSKGADVYTNTTDSNFRGAVDTALRLFEAGLLVEGWQYRGEAMRSAKHNTLCYGRAPVGNVVLFDVDTGLEERAHPEVLSAIAHQLGLECVPLVYEGEVASADELMALMDRESFLGGCKVEGVVIKNYGRWNEKDAKMLMGKVVSADFREKHRTEWVRSNPTRSDIVEAIKATYRHERRWEKAVERLRDAGKLEGSPRDIGALIKEVPADVLVECEHEIKNALFKHFWPQIQRGVTAGLPEWYKERLAAQQFAPDTAA